MRETFLGNNLKLVNLTSTGTGVIFDDIYRTNAI